jgi:hypothetical protein
VPRRSRALRCVPRWRLTFSRRVFARAAARADAAALALQVRPAPHQSRRQVLQLGQFDLKLALVALCTRRKDVQDHRCAVGHRNTQHPLEIALLHRTEGLVEDHTVGRGTSHQRLDLVGLARPDEQGRIRRLAARGHARDRLVAGRCGQQGEFLERGVEG